MSEFLLYDLASRFWPFMITSNYVNIQDTLTQCMQQILNALYRGISRCE